LVLNWNYFQYNDKHYKLTHGIAVGSPLSCTLAEIYLQYFEELMVKHWMEMHEITYYRRYVYDIIIIFDQNKINEDLITSYRNNTHKHLECKPTAEKSKNINYLDLSIHRDSNNLQIRIYRKPMQPILPYTLHPTIH